MLFKAILLLAYLSLKAAFGTAAAIDPSFKKRLQERDLSFAVRSSASNAAGLFELEGGRLSWHGNISGPADFSAAWNGWGSADTLAKKLRLNPMDYMNTGMMTFEGDLSVMDYLLVLLGGMIAAFRKKRPARVERAELGRGPS